MEKHKISMEKKGQVTIFIIIAIIIVAVGVLIYLLYPRISQIVTNPPTSPAEYLKLCVEEDVNNAVDKLSMQGGVITPTNLSYLYNDVRIEYLCYINEDYKTCVMQRPMLKEDIEKELKKEMGSTMDDCLTSMQKDYQGRAYAVEMAKGKSSVEITPEKIILHFNTTLTLTKQNTDRYNSIDVSLQNKNLYQFIMITLSILNFEARYGDSETTTYMDYYRNLKVEKLKQTDGAKIYILTDRDTKDKFQFATRSVVWPAGY